MNLPLGRAEEATYLLIDTSPKNVQTVTHQTTRVALSYFRSPLVFYAAPIEGLAINFIDPFISDACVVTPINEQSALVNGSRMSPSFGGIP
jgi:hypothetical protein